MVLDESSFDITAIPGIKVPVDYRRHFASYDGKQRNFIVEGIGGPTWYTEYNVLTGLSTRSFGRFAYFVTRIASGRVQRGLPQALGRCGSPRCTRPEAMHGEAAERAVESPVSTLYSVYQVGPPTPSTIKVRCLPWCRKRNGDDSRAAP